MGNRKDWLTLTPRPARPADRRADGRRLGEPVVVENRAGAGGNVGTALVARARGDAHTLLVGSSGPLAISPITETQLGYDPLADLTPITLLNTTPLVLVVRSASPFQDLSGLVAELRADGREVLYPTPGVGSPQLLAQEAFRQAAGFPAAPVHYPGSAPAMLAVIAGEFPFTIENLVLVAPHLSGGALRALGVTSLARAPLLPAVPTMAEQGFPGFSAGGWYGLLAPAGVPEEAVRALHVAAVAALAEPEVARRIGEMGGPPVGNSPAAFRAHILAEMTRWREVMTVAARPR
ncbi:Bug family tripartite tricarboxylate transporter substrate binding protein [Siccirubricoccus deserti]|uniref:Bug family tripartite tricarboxylate transporter substrate binding protein n=1 Tax=Siccirubricoccus deserti TaxID=2013562 RepID=UPI00227D6160|nr:tripartite tricarboxylate transporter substrate-binding protein [Siccirubricoccus deserti]